MHYTLEEYAKTFLRKNKEVSTETIRRLIHANKLPSNHHARKGKQWIIFVNDNTIDDIKKACLTYHLKKKYHASNLAELANTIAMKHNIDSKCFKTILGL